MNGKQQRNSGFTLVEMVLVTAVLAVLAGLLLVTLGPARKMARVNTCVSNLRQIGMAYKMYVADYGQYPPPAPALLVHYLSGSQPFICPEDTTFVPKGAATSYQFHYFVPPDSIPITHFHELDPGVVLVSCDNHLGQRAILDKENNTHLTPPTYPFHLVLRAEGTVQRIPLSRIKQFMRGGRRPVLITLYPGEPGYDEARN
jgi:prepilin-type N-terminal cleavage/methylation domain-containing protein